MTLDDLIDWVDLAMPELPRGRKVRDRVKHVRKVYRILSEQGNDWTFRQDWHALAVKIAKLNGREPPPKPESRGTKKRKPARRLATAERAWPGETPRPPPKPQRRLAKKPARERIEINAQLQAAFDAVAKGKQIIFVTGGAGTGKSTLIRELRARFREKQSVVLAPTGVAALNAGGQTIHSFCKLPLRPFLPEDVNKAEDPELIEKLDLVIIDEVSMVRADILDGLDAFLRLNRKSRFPFGGVQMILVGDLFQLPPVVTSRDAEVISRRYVTPHFFSALCLQGLKFFPIELEIVYRQRDPSFAGLLALIRDGSGTAEAVRRLNEHCAGRVPDGPHLILVPTRKAAETENDARLGALPGEPHTYQARREGSFETAPDDRLPAPPRLMLKEGAQVMFVRNDALRRWVNGTLATVTAVDDKTIQVVLEDGTEHEVERIEWEDIRYALDEKKTTIVEEVVGTYIQFPLMPAWAVTIHKAQGLTLERVVVDLDRGAFADGQVYVALSRCQTIEGLTLRRPVRAREVRCSEAAREFYAKIRGRGVAKQPQSRGM